MFPFLEKGHDFCSAEKVTLLLNNFQEVSKEMLKLPSHVSHNGKLTNFINDAVTTFFFQIVHFI